jgi:hypothetical protein
MRAQHKPSEATRNQTAGNTLHQISHVDRSIKMPDFLLD